MELEFHIERLNRLLKSFYQLTGIRIVIFDINHQEIASFPNYNCDFCKVIQNNKYGYSCCNKSNAKAFEHCLESDDLYIYNCHAGLIEAMINLKIDNTIVGFIMFGQISNINNKEERYNNLSNKTRKNLNISFSKELSDKLIYIDEEKLNSVSIILLALAKYAISEKMVSIQQEQFISKLNDFIDKNIEDTSLTVNDFLRYFHMSKTCFYVAMDKYIGMSIAKYLKTKRLEYAKRILENSDISLMDLTSKVGFNDYNYFCRVFKKSAHMSAEEYIKTVRKKLQ